MPQAGIITTKNWLFAPDGDQYRAFWCETWLLVTDKEFPVPDFRSAERWGVFAFDNGVIVAIIPGCDVAGYTVCKSPPATTSIYKFGKE